jgi:DNA-binding MarR family transcriptional regulator
MATFLDLDKYIALACFRYAMRKFLRFSKEFLAAKAELTPEQYEALLAIKAFGSSDGLLVGHLSERLQVKPHTAVALTDKLVKRKLATKVRAAADRRQVYVKLTETGANLLATVAKAHFEAMRVHAPEMMEALKELQDTAM